jgi:hypothetical protein
MTDTETHGFPTYTHYAADLRALADRLDDSGYRLPLPKYPDQGLSIDIHTASHLDVDQAAGILDVETRLRNGLTTAEFNVGTVHVHFVHVDAAAMAKHTARMARANAVTS